jgi:hypothetical protein
MTTQERAAVYKFMSAVSFAQQCGQISRKNTEIAAAGAELAAIYRADVLESHKEEARKYAGGTAI